MGRHREDARKIGGTEERMWAATEETRINDPESWEHEQYNRMQKEIRIGPELTMANFGRPTVAREQARILF